MQHEFQPDFQLVIQHLVPISSPYKNDTEKGYQMIFAMILLTTVIGASCLLNLETIP